ncbi:FAD-dependent oxidoreductase [Salinimicrobium marinum]|uniref:FAD-dependent oxidoreductase n=1 Tax=Salinimicrobium marinum TaxID=680283 RepID=A0A918S720_9FLAO|nr:FAD-binding oxidoreductase [Salinimicrobium marinum]GHA24749.1 FAD-dependent oxidoreductase [Salinimicrobium marinum]
MLDYIIVGLGLGGASTAFRLEEMGQSFLVFEDGSVNSSKVAGGVMNPVILKRFTLAWQADAQLKDAKGFYKRLENHLNTTFFSAVEIYRKFSSVEEQNDWFAAADRSHLAPFLDTKLKAAITPGIPSEYSFGRVLQTSKVDTRKLLNTYLEYLLREEKLRKERFFYEDLKVSEDYVEYRGVKARRIIFCDGFGIRKNPFFSYLPLGGNKGEYIIIKARELQLEVTVKSSIFISPLGSGMYAVGATYNNQDKTPGPTAEAREELVKKLEKIITVPYEVVDQVVGIRPSTADRRPLVGKHPEMDNVYCCNGFGSRGVLIAPAASAELLNLIEHAQPVSSEYDLARFTRKHFKRN